MSRAVVIVLALLGSGCSWAWHELQPVDDGGARDASAMDASPPDAGARSDAGALDAGPGPCDFGVPCAEPGQCVRGVNGTTVECCYADLCLPRGDRPFAWAREITTGGGWPPSRRDAMDGDAHWGAGTPVYWLTSVTTDGPAPSAADGRASFRVAWGPPVGLMLFISVDDDQVTRDAGPGYDGVDVLEITLDVHPADPGAPDGVLHEDEETRVFLPLRDGLPAQGEKIFEGREWDRTEVYYRERAGGFDFEVGFNWHNLEGTAPLPVARDVVALDVRWYDRDSDGSEHIHSWSDCRRAVGDGFGLVVLTPDGTTPPTADCMPQCAGNDLCVPMDYACDPGAPTVCAP